MKSAYFADERSLNALIFIINRDIKRKIVFGGICTAVHDVVENFNSFARAVASLVRMYEIIKTAVRRNSEFMACLGDDIIAVFPDYLGSIFSSHYFRNDPAPLKFERLVWRDIAFFFIGKNES